MQAFFLAKDSSAPMSYRRSRTAPLALRRAFEVRSDQLDLAALQSRLLIHDVIYQPVRRKHVRVSRAPIVFDSPVADENHQRPYPFVQLAVVLDELMDFPCIPARLFQRIFFFRKPVDEQSFAISKSDLTLATSELRLDRENSRRSDDHVID